MIGRHFKEDKPPQIIYSIPNTQKIKMEKEKEQYQKQIIKR